MKNAVCVNGTIEITLEQIQHDIATSKSPRIRVMCVKTLKMPTVFPSAYLCQMDGKCGDLIGKIRIEMKISCLVCSFCKDEFVIY